MVERDFSWLLHGSWALLIFVLLMFQPAIYQGIIKASLTPSMAIWTPFWQVNSAPLSAKN